MMKHTVALLLSFMMLVTCVTALPTASATHSEVTIHTGESYEITVQLSQGATFVFGWTANHALSEVFQDPNGAVIKAETGNPSGGTAYAVPTTGQYTMTWTNLQSTDATLKVDYFTNVNSIIDTWIIVMILGLVILVVIVVVVVFLAFKRPKTPPAPPQPPQY